MQHFLNPATTNLLKILPQAVRIHSPSIVTGDFFSFPCGMRAWFL
jgi:hypothetical protein